MFFPTHHVDLSLIYTLNEKNVFGKKWVLDFNPTFKSF